MADSAQIPQGTSIASGLNDHFRRESSYARCRSRTSNDRNITVRPFGLLLVATVILVLLHVDITSADNETSQAKKKCAEWGSCDQLCENSEGSFECSCFPGYAMIGRNKCSAASGPPMRLLLSQNTDIWQMNSIGEYSEIIAHTQHASGVDYLYSKEMIYWSDLKSEKIYSKSVNMKNLGNDSRFEMNRVVEVTISMPVSWSPVSIAIDFIGMKLYVVDSMAQKIDVFELDGRRHAIVLNANLTNATDIALDPTVGLMFIADEKQILRANMDGTSAYPVIHQEVYNPLGVAIDIAAKRIYWSDASHNYIETADYTGANRFTILRGPQLPNCASLAVFENRVYWSDLTKHGLFSMDKFEGENTIQKLSEGREINAIKILHPLVQSAGNVTNPCGNNNGGCQHMCIVTAADSAESGISYRCLCEVGWRLNNDSHNCDPVTEFLLYLQKNEVKSRQLDPVTEGSSDVILPIAERRAVFVSVDYDARDDYIYFSDAIRNTINRVHRNGSGREIIWTKRKSSVEGLAFDWEAKNLYYINAIDGTLDVLSTRNVTYRKTLLKDLKNPRGLVVYPSRGYIFIGGWGNQAKISRVFTDGTNHVVFKNLTLGWVNDLAIDFTKDRLYWCDALLQNVRHTDLDGGDVRTITSPLLKRAFSIAIHEQWMYITTWQLHAIIRMKKETGDEETILVKAPHSKRVNGITVFSRKIQTVTTGHPCSMNNGGCEKFCFAVPDNGNNRVSGLNLYRVCGCPYGEILEEDQRTCTVDPE